MSGRAVADYLRGLVFPPENRDIEGARLAVYIEDQIRELTAELEDINHELGLE